MLFDFSKITKFRQPEKSKAAAKTGSLDDSNDTPKPIWVWAQSKLSLWVRIVQTSRHGCILWFEFIYRNKVVLPLFQSDSKQQQRRSSWWQQALTAEQRELHWPSYISVPICQNPSSSRLVKNELKVFSELLGPPPSSTQTLVTIAGL